MLHSIIYGKHLGWFLVYGKHRVNLIILLPPASKTFKFYLKIIGDQ